jgi:hypothetical protein
MKGNGKIAKLPDHIREELNTRLRNDEPIVRLVVWLNSLPEVQAALAQHFQGRPIKRQNVEEWKQNSYQKWLVKKLREEVMSADKDKDPALKELRTAFQKYISDIMEEHVAWYRRGYTDALLGVPPWEHPNLTGESKIGTN